MSAVTHGGQGASGGSGRGGLWVAVLVVLGVLGIAAWFTLGGAGAYEAPAHDHSLTSRDGTPDVPPTIGVPDAPAPEPLSSAPVAGGARTPSLASTPGVKPPENSGNIVAKGHVRWAGGTVPFESDLKLYDVEGSELESAMTDQDGSFEIHCDETLEAGWSFGTDAIDVPWKGVLVELLPALVADLPEHRPGQPPVERDLVIGYGPALAGRVVDKVTHQPIEGAVVHVGSTLRPYAYEELDADTDADGRFHLPLMDMPLTGLITWCVADDHQTVLVGPLDLRAAAAPEQPATQDFALPAPILVKGRITDARTREPIDGAVVTVGSRYPAFSLASNFELTDAAGGFELDATEVPTEGGWLIVTSAECAPQVLPLEKGEQFVELALGAPSIVAGTVVDEAGHGVPEASVQIVFEDDTPDFDQMSFDRADCDAEGRFDTVLELVPDEGALLRVEQVGKVTFQAKLTEIAKPLPGNRWDVEIRLRAK